MRRLLILALPCLLALAGCVYVPPVWDVEDAINKLDEVEPGKTTRIDVLERLGEPTRTNSDETVLWYSGSESGGLLAIIAATPSGSYGGAKLLYETPWWVRVHFDADGVVKKLCSSKDTEADRRARCSFDEIAQRHRIDLGRTTRADVLKLLGTPDARSANGRDIRYGSPVEAFVTPHKWWMTVQFGASDVVERVCSSEDSLVERRTRCLAQELKMLNDLRIGETARTDVMRLFGAPDTEGSGGRVFRYESHRDGLVADDSWWMTFLFDDRDAVIKACSALDTAREREQRCSLVDFAKHGEVKTGKTVRAQVLRLLGEPDVRDADDRVFLYEDENLVDPFRLIGDRVAWLAFVFDPAGTVDLTCSSANPDDHLERCRRQLENMGWRYSASAGWLQPSMRAYGQVLFKNTLRRAKCGDYLAQAMVAEEYRVGRVVPRDYVQAYKWLRLAQMGGHKGAQRTLETELKAAMTEPEIAEAECLVAAWRPRHCP